MNATIPIHAATLPGEIPAAGSAELRGWAASVGHHLAERGGLAVERQLAALAGLARRHRVAAVSGAVLIDRSQPEVAWARAFPRVVSALVELKPATRDDGVAAA